MTNDLIESIEREIFNRSTGDFFSKDDEIKFLCPAHKETNPSALWKYKKLLRRQQRGVLNSLFTKVTPP
ncbi:MAG: hypothetical protein ACKVKP_15185 [Acidimicrobiales bacterium]